MPPGWAVPHCTNLLGTSYHTEAKTWGLTLEARAGEEWVVRKYRGEKTKQVGASQIGMVFMLENAVGARGLVKEVCALQLLLNLIS